MARRTTIATVIGSTRWSAPAPASASTTMIASGPYATDVSRVERQSRKALDRRDLLLGYLAGPQRPADEQVPRRSPGASSDSLRSGTSAS